MRRIRMRDDLAPDAQAIALPGEAAVPELPPHLDPPPTLWVIPEFVRQAWHEVRVRKLRHIQFRSRENQKAREAYAAMDPWEFEGINARQAWANWRTIARNLEGRLPREPVRAIDLCCGTGQSTAVIAHHLSAGSEILGLEFSPRLVGVARSRSYPNVSGEPLRVRFRAQSVLEPFRDEEGELVAEGSVDLVNSCGAVGCHFDPEATRTLAAEVARVVRPGGIAAIDSGRSGTGPADVQAIFVRHGFEAIHRARSCFLDPYLQICFRKRAA